MFIVPSLVLLGVAASFSKCNVEPSIESKFNLIHCEITKAHQFHKCTRIQGIVRLVGQVLRTEPGNFISISQSERHCTLCFAQRVT